jgi:hypothetical protein
LPHRSGEIRLNVGKAVRLLLCAFALALCAVFPAGAELSQDGDLVVSFDAAIHPSTLPRVTRVPVAVRVAGDIRSAGGEKGHLPQLRTITVAINRQGRLFDRGLPTCDVKTIEPASERAARKVCGETIVGAGHVRLQARLPTQPTVEVRAKLLAFNGPRKDGQKLILAQVYGRNPPGAFVLAFRISRHKGLFGTVMSTTLPRSAQHWAYLTHFDMTLSRTYSFRGRRRAYVSAACEAPAGFDTALFPFARATYGFDDGRSLETSVARSCHVMGRQRKG